VTAGCLNWQKIRRICASYNCLFIINNRADIAYLCKADGVHLGQADIEIKNAKSIMSKKAIFGSSCHSKKELKKANALDEKVEKCTRIIDMR